MDIAFQFLNFLFSLAPFLFWVATVGVSLYCIYRTVILWLKWEREQFSFARLVWGIYWRAAVLLFVLFAFSSASQYGPRLVLDPPNKGQEYATQQRGKELPPMTKPLYSPTTEDQIQQEMEEYQEDVRRRGSID